MRYFLDLFAGIGGFALSAEWAGLRFDKHYFSEVDDYAIKVYSKRFPDSIALGDITKIDGRQLPAGDWIIAGGFPCQDISIAGKGAGLDGARSGLWFEYARLIGELRPRFAIMENVGALTHRGLDRVLGSLAEIGYDAEWQDIRASDVGAPHRRERIWIVAYPSCNARNERWAESAGQLGEAGAANGSDDVANADGARLEEHGMLDAVLPVGSSEAGTSTESIKTNVAYPASISEREQADEANTIATFGQPRNESMRSGEHAEALAYPDLQHGQRRPEPQQPAGVGRQSRDQPARSGVEGTDNVADADETQRARDRGAEPAEQEYAATGRPGSGQGWWATEPDVGGTLDGLPAWLDGFDMSVSHELLLTYGKTEKTGTGGILRALRCQVGEEILQGEARGFVGLSAQKVLLSYLCKLQENYADETRIQLEGAQAFEGSLRGLRGDDELDGASYRPGQGEQFAREHTDSLQALSRLLARHAEKAWSLYRWKNARPVLTHWLPGWEDGIPRTSSNIPSRLDRLKCLGNSIVPQIAMMIFQQIERIEHGN